MPGLAELPVKRAYHKPEDDIARAFYLPALAASSGYDRAVGFFSSTIFIIAWPSLKAFVANGGRMRLICSPVLSDEDHDAMRSGYSDRANEDLATAISESFAAMMSAKTLARPAVVLASLIAAGVIDCKVAWVGDQAGGRPRRLFHDKVGILRDGFGNGVVFKGSMNETWPGLSIDGNLESVDVFASWKEENERRRIKDEQDYFDRLWDDAWPGVTTRPLPDSARAEIVSAADAAHWPDFVDDICLEMERAAAWSPEAGLAGGRVPRPHQVQALDKWAEQGRRGILEHATGSGKTFTAVCAVNDGLRRQEVPLVIVPSDLLLKQWERELRSAFADAGMQLLVCGGGHADWRTGSRLRDWTRRPSPSHKPRAVLSTLQTASGSAFMRMCSQGAHLFLVADEVHRLGAAEARQVFALDTGPRLGLSATPRRAGDPEGTAAIMAYFTGVVPPPFTLKDAIKAGALTPYAYHVHTTRLEPEEQDRWNAITAILRQLQARAKDSKDAPATLLSRIKLESIRRARVVKSARRKVNVAVEVLTSHYQPGQHWIVYCDDREQLSAVKRALMDAGVPEVLEYHSSMEGDRSRTLDLFTARGGVVVSIRCLDEGVDIPAVSHALILASSRNPREFIQRRGRVLRRSTGKFLAHIHDVIVTPGHDEVDATSIVAAELARAINFGVDAVNPACVTDLRRIAATFGIDLAAADSGFEDDQEDEAMETVDA